MTLWTWYQWGRVTRRFALKKGHNATKVWNHWWRSFLLNGLWSTWISGQIAPQYASLRDSTHLKVWRQRDKTEGGIGVTVVWKPAAATRGKQMAKTTTGESRGTKPRWASTEHERAASVLMEPPGDPRREHLLSSSYESWDNMRRRWRGPEETCGVRACGRSGRSGLAGERIERDRRFSLSTTWHIGATETFKPPKLQHACHLSHWPWMQHEETLSQLSYINVICRWHALKRRQRKFQNFAMKNPQKWQK